MMASVSRDPESAQVRMACVLSESLCTHKDYRKLGADFLTTQLIHLTKKLAWRTVTQHYLCQ